MSAAKFWRPHAEGVEIFVRLTPKSARDALEGVDFRDDGACVLKARVRAVPEDGKANAALIALLAKTLKIPASRIKLAAGATARQKTLILGGDPEELFARLQKLES